MTNTMNARELIADVLNGEALQWLSGRDELLPAADAILAAMPDIIRSMVVPLVWEITGYIRGNRPIYTSNMGHVISTEYGFDLGVPRSDSPYAVQHQSLEAAKAAANADNVTKAMAALGIEVE